MRKLIKDLQDREILKDVSNFDKLYSLEKSSGVYTGFDPTAKSLHLGNYITIINLMRFKNAGYKVYAIVGGVTGMIGDPSFRDSERKFLSDEELLNNKNHIIKQLQSFGLEVIDNYDFYKNMTIVDFLKTVGKHANVNYMLAKDSVKQRLENGMTFTEFTYQLFQGWDFKELYEKHNVMVQMGGSDQWGNITTGLEMIKNIHGDNHKAVALTSNLLTGSNGKKIGKSYGGGSLWLDPIMTSPYNIYQYLINQSDEDVEKLMKWLTFLTIDEISQIMTQHNENKRERIAQKRLAFETVKIIHSEQIAKQCVSVSEKLFSNTLLDLTLDDIELLKGFLKTYQYNNESVIDFMTGNKIVSSRREFREFMNNESIRYDDYIVTDENELIKFNNFENRYVLLKKNKKEFIIIEK
ncbi:tyrosine--tRNA ligase [Mycoplasma phocoenae]|nr:tyrosine--tRNA ligase [Mycoplasma phocoenae]